jgi:hypothetical protein
MKATRDPMGDRSRALRRTREAKRATRTPRGPGACAATSTLGASGPGAGGGTSTLVASGPGACAAISTPVALSLALALVACGVPDPPGTTGGIGDAAMAPTGGDAGQDGECSRGFSVIGTSPDYVSTNVSLVTLEGEALSESFASSATTDVGLSAPLSGDVVPPTMPSCGSDLVLIDRLPTSRILWLDLATGNESARLDVGMGYSANPHDYALIAPDKAYVTRFNRNPNPGSVPLDEGGDVLVIDPRVPEAISRIDLAPAMRDLDASFQPRPDRVVLQGNMAYALLAPSTSNSVTTAPARLVAIDTTTDTITDVLVLGGLHGCAGLSLAPDQTFAVVGCVAWDEHREVHADRSGLAVVDLVPELRLRRVLESRVHDLGGIGFYVSVAGPRTALATVSGRFATRQTAAEPDRLVEVDLETAETRTILEREEAFTLGEIRCHVGSSRCVAADAGVPGGLLQVLTLDDDGHVVEAQGRVVERRIALAPRYIGRF